MRQLLALITILASSSLGAEEQGRVQQFSLVDGRVVQAMRFIKIATPQKTTFTITLADGSKLTLDGEDVLKIRDVCVPASQLPASLNVEKKEPVAVEPVRPEVLREPPVVVPSPYSDVPAPVIYTRVVHHFIQPDPTPRPPTPPPPPVVYAPPPPPTSSDIARRSFCTIPGSPVTSPNQPRR